MWNIIWLWKHRHCRRDFQELWENRAGLKKLVREMSLIRLDSEIDEDAVRNLAKNAHEINKWLRDLGSIRFPRPYPPLPNRPVVGSGLAHSGKL